MNVEISENEGRVSTSTIATGFQIEERSVVLTIEKYKSDFESFGKLPKINTSKGKQLVKDSHYLLNEDQFMFFGALTKNSAVSVAFKRILITDYAKCKRLLASIGKQQSTTEWQAHRLEGKIARRLETDAIKRFINYAKAQGSSNAEKYYTNITKMENALLFIVAGKFKNLRDVMTGQQLLVVGMADKIIDKALDDGMALDMPYKDIFQLVKSRIVSFAALSGQSEIVDKMLLD